MLFADSFRIKNSIVTAVLSKLSTTFALSSFIKTFLIRLEEELRLIQLDLSRVPNAEKIEGEKREIMDEIEQIKKETAQKHMELKNLRVRF